MKHDDEPDTRTIARYSVELPPGTRECSHCYGVGAVRGIECAPCYGSGYDGKVVEQTMRAVREGRIAAK